MSLREGSTDDAFSVACVCGFPWQSTSSGERDASDTSGVTLHRRGEHTGRGPQELFLFAPHFTPLRTVDPGRQVTKLISLNNSVAGSTEPARQETLTALLERMSAFQIRV